jgi:hypothetical protein
MIDVQLLFTISHVTWMITVDGVLEDENSAPEKANGRAIHVD